MRECTVEDIGVTIRAYAGINKQGKYTNIKVDEDSELLEWSCDNCNESFEEDDMIDEHVKIDWGKA